MFILWLAVPLVCLSSYLFVSEFYNPSVTFAESIPVVGLRKQSFKTVRASFRQLTDGMRTLLDGYRQYSQHGRPFLIHDPSFQKELMLPPEHIKWFSNQPDSTLSSAEVRKERHAVRYLNIGVEFGSTVFFLERIIGDSLRRKLDMIQGPMYDEIRLGMDEVFGLDETEWRTVNVYNSLQEIILSSMSRVLFGLPLGRDKTFLTSFRRYILAMGIGTIVIGELPRMLKGLIVPIFNVPLWYLRRKTLKALLPVVIRQLSERDDNQAKAGKDQNDFITQSVSVSAKMSNVPDASDPKILAEWIMLLGFAALTSTVIQASNIVLDILSCSPEMQVYESLRAEATSSIKTNDDWNSNATFKSLTLSDSVIRESLRYHPILIKGLTKEVVRSEGLELPDGTHIPRGGWIGVPVLGLHMDERFYPNPQTYDPFRFAKLKQDRENSRKGEGSTRTFVNNSDLDAAQPSTTYLGFGYGRHACPGRWFAVLMLKIILAYLTLNYDVESTGPRPKARVIGDAALPPVSATIRIRRRKRSGTA